MFDGVLGGASAGAEPDRLRQALHDAIAAAQRRGNADAAGTLIGVLVMADALPAGCLQQTRALRRRVGDIEIERWLDEIVLRLEERL